MSTSASKFPAGFSRCTSVLAITFGGMVLTGWVLHVQRLKGIIPGQVAAKANAAVCFILIGLALWLAITGRKKPLANALFRSLALAASMVGLLSFLEFLYGWDFGIDQLLFTAGPDDLAGSVRPGLMSPIAACDFFLLGITIALLEIKERWSLWVQSLFAAIAAVASALGVLDFALDPESTHTYISPLTALILFLFSFAVLCARTERGLGALLVSLTPGGDLSRRLLPAAILLPVALGWLWWDEQKTGRFSDWTGIVLMIVSSGVLLAGLTLWTAFALDRVELAREHAEESVRRLAAIVTSSNDAIIGKTLDGIVTSWNPGAEAIYGYSAEEMIGRSVNRVVPADRLDEFESLLQALRRGETVRHYETERVRRDGKRIAASVSISPLKDEKGRIVGASTIARDISERKRAEQALADERRRFEEVLDRLPVMVCLLKPDYSVAFANRSFRRQFGASDGRKCYEVRFGQSAPCEFCQSFNVLKSGRPIDWELVTNDGRVVHSFDSPFTDSDGSPLILKMDVDVTEQKEAERKIREASRYTRSLIEASLDPLVTISKLGKITDVNKATEIATGHSRDGLIGSDFCDYFTEPEKAREGYARVFEEGSVRDYPLAIRNASGAVMDVLYNATVFDGANGEVEGVFAAARDITERKRAEDDLRRASRYSRSLIEASLDPLVTISKQGKIIDVNQATETATGLSRDRLIGSDFCDYFTEREKAREGYGRVFKEGLVRDYPLAIRNTSGAVMDVLYNATVFKGETDEVESVFAAARDITQRKQAEEALRTESSFRRSIIENAAEGLCVCQMVDVFPYVRFSVWNERMRQITGYGMEEINSKGWYQTMYPDPQYQERARQRMLCMRDGDNLHGESWEITRRDGEKRLLQITTSVVTANNGTRHVLALMDDVSELKRTEQELRLSRERLTLALQAGHSGTFDWDMQNNVNRWTPEVEAVHGLAPGEFGGTFEDWEALVLPADLPSARACIESSLKTGEFAGDWRIRRHNDGQVRWITARAKILNDDKGKPWRMIGLNMDVTERKQAEEEVSKLNDELEQRVIRRTAELEAANKELEAFTYSVSHDLRAPLRHISGFSKMLSEEFSESLPPDAQHHVQRIQEGTRRMGQLVDDLLNLGRVGRKDLSLEVAGLRSIIDDVIENLKADVGDRQVEWKIGDLPYVECDTALIQQVFQNLLSNALKFTRPRAKTVIEIGQEQRDGSSVVYVRDNGVGFSMKYADKLFGVFQRLHRAEDFEGTGVGLATVQRIIQKHGGRIWAEAELDKGAKFYFTLGASQGSEAIPKRWLQERNHDRSTN